MVDLTHDHFSGDIGDEAEIEYEYDANLSTSDTVVTKVEERREGGKEERMHRSRFS